MQILNFRVKNHKSLRDETALELLDSSLTTLKPSANKTWGQYVHTVAGIFGANASGKSNLLDALRYFVTALKESSASWQNAKVFPHKSFKFESRSRNSETIYELDFLLDNVRYRYSFGTSSDGITFERLENLPNSRWRTIFTRECTKEAETITFARGVKKFEVSRRELVLSRAATLKRNDLPHAVADAIMGKIDFILLSENDRKLRINAITDALAEASITSDEIAQLLQVADIGIQKVDIWQSEDDFDMDNPPQNIPRPVQQIAQQVLRRIVATGQDSEDDSDDSTKPIARIIQRRLEFFHHSSSHDAPALYLADESDGTLAWLATSVAVLEALRNGGVVCGDELDSSLHPHLVRLLIDLFTDASINTRGAQLIFTTHDATLLHRQEELGLIPENIWFTEKNHEGVTELFSLADFPREKGANIEKRYLAGVYGAVPLTAGSIFKTLVESFPSHNGS